MLQRSAKVYYLKSHKSIRCCGIFYFGAFIQIPPTAAAWETIGTPVTVNKDNPVFDLSAAIGNESFDSIGIYHYRVTEQADNRGGITYDTTSYTVTVTVVDNLDGTLSAAYTVENNAKLEFVNVYNNGALETGNSSVLCLPLILAAGFGALGLLYYKKKKETI